MNKEEAFDLKIVPGRIHAAAAHNGQEHNDNVKKQPFWQVDIPFEQWSMEKRADISRDLAQNPYEVFGLLRGQTPPWLEEMLQSCWQPKPDQAACNCGRGECGHISEVLTEAYRHIRLDPFLGLALFGLERGPLLDAVFQDWAAKMPKASGAADGGDLSRLEEKGKAGPSAGEWLAEAAEQGKLHEPGALYHEVVIHLDNVPDGEPKADDWSELLPKVKSVQQVISQITTEAAGKARESLNLIPKSL
ncbi:hypothetical protein G8C92_25445 [Paenibacillus donghaensis]|uniref:hypothetical protein n=1 Tax=Paenibacillus donghaensis TaxID=414771 RepID=UPI001883676B|nr:hypothetical protein [Paenibacillus donghaensis]MBE9917367.1 hypothetical protein [Paenibacillus donghaensis]